MSNRRGEWPTWLMVSTAGGTFLCGLLVAWAVFAEPARAEMADAQPVDESKLLERLAALEAKLAGDSVIEALRVKHLLVVPADGKKARIHMHSDVSGDWLEFSNDSFENRILLGVNHEGRVIDKRFDGRE